MEEQKNETGCCPRFNPEPWEDKVLNWDNKRFIRDKVKCFFYMPLDFGKVMRRLGKKISAAGAQMPDYLCLSDHPSKWRMDIFLAVDKEVKEVENVFLSGKYYVKVYEGDFNETGKWCKDYAEKAQEKGIKTGKMYMWYTTCPKCAKVYGKNYVAIIAEII
ncbi:MAG: hypothetical protein PHZ12_09055 [Paludibacter sp.]|nr:hypothetical protein [Paludibacter sp.]MDD4428400.1 hypothetical protein [Paludibacter sp.]